MRALVIISLLVLLPLSQSWASYVTVTGTLTANATWQDTVLIQNNLIVLTGVTLLILPGAVVLFDSIPGEHMGNRNHIRILGNLVAQGSVNKPITFQSLYDDGTANKSLFYGIQVGDGANYTFIYCTFGHSINLFSIENPNPNNHIAYCTFKYVHNVLFYSPKNIEADHCLFIQCNTAFYHPRNALIHHNIFWKCNSYALDSFDDKTYFYNNVIYGVQYEWGAIRYNPVQGNIQQIFNNIIAGSKYAINFNGQDEMDAVDLRYNLYFNCDYLYGAEIPNNTPPQPYEFLNDVGSFIGDPLFVDAEGMDFRVLPGSPCINAGDPATRYNDPDGTRSDIGLGIVYNIALIEPDWKILAIPRILNTLDFSIGIANLPIKLFLADGSLISQVTTDHGGRVNFSSRLPSGLYYLLPSGTDYKPIKIVLIK